MEEQHETTQPTPRPVEPYGYDPGDEISLIELLNVVLKNRRLVVLTPFVVFVLVVGYVFLQPRTFTSSASFMPQTGGGGGSLTSLAAQFGFSVPTSEGGQSPQFYANLITSREILQGLVDTTYTFRDGEQMRTGTLSEILEIESEDPAEAREKTIQTLGDLISKSTDRETGLVSFSVQTQWRDLSSILARTILERLNRFNLETRQSQAGSERRFVESRMQVASDSLRQAEDALQSFLQKNTQFDTSPALVFIHDRLEREVGRRQSVYNTLSQAYEQARIDEVRDTPVFTMVQKPEPPVLPDRRRLLLKGILALMVGGMLGIFGAFGREFMLRGREQEADHFREFEQLKRATLQDIRRPWRFLKG